ncbi:hypothetical protein, partial [Methyloligella halotolerans]|uniref:hypothetical protein n=1 Tax=Methyloligella halotolerans TaxID=1177755 RepID=UPI001ABA1B97
DLTANLLNKLVPARGVYKTLKIRGHWVIHYKLQSARNLPQPGTFGKSNQRPIIELVPKYRAALEMMKKTSSESGLRQYFQERQKS